MKTLISKSLVKKTIDKHIFPNKLVVQSAQMLNGEGVWNQEIISSEFVYDYDDIQDAQCLVYLAYHSNMNEKWFTRKEIEYFYKLYNVDKL